MLVVELKRTTGHTDAPKCRYIVAVQCGPHTYPIYCTNAPQLLRTLAAVGQIIITSTNGKAAHAAAVTLHAANAAKLQRAKRYGNH